jgi:hypothetical protein
MRLMIPATLAALTLGLMACGGSDPGESSQPRDRDTETATVQEAEVSPRASVEDGSLSIETVLDRVGSTNRWACRPVENDFTWSCTGVDTNVFVVDTATATIQSEFVAGNGGTRCLVSSDGRWFVTAYGDGGAVGVAEEASAIDLLAPMIGGREAC